MSGLEVAEAGAARRFSERHSAELWRDLLEVCGAVQAFWPEFEPEGFLHAVEWGAYEILSYSRAYGYLRRALWALGEIQSRTGGATEVCAVTCRYWLAFTHGR